MQLHMQEYNRGRLQHFRTMSSGAYGKQFKTMANKKKGQTEGNPRALQPQSCSAMCKNVGTKSSTGELNLPHQVVLSTWS